MPKSGVERTREWRERKRAGEVTVQNVKIRKSRSEIVRDSRLRRKIRDSLNGVNNKHKSCNSIVCLYDVDKNTFVDVPLTGEQNPSLGQLTSCEEKSIDLDQNSSIDPSLMVKQNPTIDLGNTSKEGSTKSQNSSINGHSSCTKEFTITTDLNDTPVVQVTTSKGEDQTNSSGDPTLTVDNNSSGDQVGPCQEDSRTSDDNSSIAAGLSTSCTDLVMDKQFSVELVPSSKDETAQPVTRETEDEDDDNFTGSTVSDHDLCNPDDDIIIDTPPTSSAGLAVKTNPTIDWSSSSSSSSSPDKTTEDWDRNLEVKEIQHNGTSTFQVTLPQFDTTPQFVFKSISLKSLELALQEKLRYMKDKFVEKMSRQFKCQVCWQDLPDHPSYLRHIVVCPVSCEECGELFPTKADERTHFAKHRVGKENRKTY